MALPLIEDFIVPSIGLLMSDIRSATRLDANAAKKVFWKTLYADVMNVERPGVDLCQDGDPGCDPEKPTLNLIAYEGRALKIVGMLNLYNMTIERVAQGKTELSAMPAPGVAAVAGLSVKATWRVILQHMLENDLSFVDGTLIDIVQWDFPEIERQRWERGPGSDGIIDGLVGDGHDYEARDTGGDDYPKSVRRSGAPTNGSR